MPKGTLYLIPNVLNSPLTNTIPVSVQEVVQQTSTYIVENTKEARRYLIKLGIKTWGISPDSLTFLELDKHANEQQQTHYLRTALEGKNIGLISDAGCPAVADPGSGVVAAAHRQGIRVVPLVGPSSILLALMASGMNGQNFAFNGYLPITTHEKKQQLVALEKKVWQQNQTQIFMETPYRNQQLFDDVLQCCQGNTRLCVARNLTLPDEWIQTRTIAEWKKMTEKPLLHKQPTVFVLGK